MNNMVFVVRWQDDSGKPQSKEYGDETTARKAKAWLLDRGIKAVDIAIKKKEEG